MEEQAARRATIRLIESDDEQPKVALTPGRRFEVIATPVVDSDLNSVSEETKGQPLRPSRLCGSHSTCVAILEIE